MAKGVDHHHHPDRAQVLAEDHRVTEQFIDLSQHMTQGRMSTNAAGLGNQAPKSGLRFNPVTGEVEPSEEALASRGKTGTRDEEGRRGAGQAARDGTEGGRSNIVQFPGNQAGAATSMPTQAALAERTKLEGPGTTDETAIAQDQVLDGVAIGNDPIGRGVRTFQAKSPGVESVRNLFHSVMEAPARHSQETLALARGLIFAPINDGAIQQITAVVIERIQRSADAGYGANLTGERSGSRAPNHDACFMSAEAHQGIKTAYSGPGEMLLELAKSRTAVAAGGKLGQCRSFMRAEREAELQAA